MNQQDVVGRAAMSLPGAAQSHASQWGLGHLGWRGTGPVGSRLHAGCRDSGPAGHSPRLLVLGEDWERGLFRLPLAAADISGQHAFASSFHFWCPGISHAPPVSSSPMHLLVFLFSFLSVPKKDDLCEGSGN